MNMSEVKPILAGIKALCTFKSCDTAVIKFYSRCCCYCWCWSWRYWKQGGLPAVPCVATVVVQARAPVALALHQGHHWQHSRRHTQPSRSSTPRYSSSTTHSTPPHACSTAWRSRHLNASRSATIQPARPALAAVGAPLSLSLLHQAPRRSTPCCARLTPRP